MSTKGIIFSAPMVRALLAGTKTQTRRLLRNPEYYGCPTGDCPHETQAECDKAMAGLNAKEANGYAAGDRLYVREAVWITPSGWTDSPVNPMGPQRQEVAYKADDRSGYAADAAKDYKLRLHPSIHMPRWASRLWLEVTEVRVDRLQSISEADAIAEGVTRIWPEGSLSDSGSNHFTAAVPGWSINAPTARETYALLWQWLHTEPGQRWEDNPWVVAVSFAVHHGNINQAAP